MTSKYLCIGPGGRKCVCCFPAPGKRKAEYRKAKRNEAKESMKVEMAEMYEEPRS